jgi:hypothetical protein
MWSESANLLADGRSHGDQCVLEQQLRIQILCALETAGYPELRSVRCQVDEGSVVLRGVLPSYHLKQVAQQAILALHDTRVVKNLIDVSSQRAAGDFAVGQSEALSTER